MIAYAELSVMARTRPGMTMRWLRGVSQMKVGVAGLGKMGAPIAARLIESGHEVTVWNRTPDKTKPLTEAGASAVKTAADVTNSSDIVITILADAAAIEEVYNGPAGLLSCSGRNRSRASHRPQGCAQRRRP